MFGHHEEGRGDDARGGTDVEGGVAVAACADDVAEAAAVGALGEVSLSFPYDGAESGPVDGEGSVAHGGGARRYYGWVSV